MFSFEFFPPKTRGRRASLLRTIDNLRELEPSFVSVTYGAGGTHAREDDRASSPASSASTASRPWRTSPASAIAATRSPPSSTASPTAGHRERARPARRSAARRRHLRAPRQRLRLRQRAGAPSSARAAIRSAWPAPAIRRAIRSAATSSARHRPSARQGRRRRRLRHHPALLRQRDYFAFVERARRAGITVPIVPGIMPITNVAQIERIAGLCGARIPRDSARAAARRRRRRGRRARRSASITPPAQCRDLLAGGAPGIHFYTLNQSPATARDPRRAAPLRPRCRRSSPSRRSSRPSARRSPAAGGRSCTSAATATATRTASASRSAASAASSTSMRCACTAARISSGWKRTHRRRHESLTPRLAGREPLLHLDRACAIRSCAAALPLPSPLVLARSAWAPAARQPPASPPPPPPITEGPGTFKALLINGGGKQQSNFQSHLTHVRTLVEFLQANGADARRHHHLRLRRRRSRRRPRHPRAPRRQRRLLAAAAARRATAAAGAVRRLDGRRLHPRSPATYEALHTWFTTEGKKLRPGDTLLFYVTDHGEQNKTRPDQQHHRALEREAQRRADCASSSPSSTRACASSC